MPSRMINFLFYSTRSSLFLGGAGSFTFELGMYKSNAYINPVSSYPINLKLNDEAYFQVTASVDDSELLMLVDKCYSTPSLNRNALPQHSLIRNG